MGAAGTIAKSLNALIGHEFPNVLDWGYIGMKQFSEAIQSRKTNTCPPIIDIPGVMLLYPLYSSMRAIESPSPLDDQQWLTYWVLYSFITLFELSCWKVLQWLPFWPYIKLVCCMWLVLPIFNGAAYIHENIIRKHVKVGSHVSSNYPQNQRKALQMMSLDARKAVERYIEKYGPDAFDKVVRAAEREAKKH